LMRNASDPAVSTDGRRIAFVGDLDGIWVMRRDGSGQRRLTVGEPYDHDPAWSSDGRIVYFSRTDFQTASIFSVHADGSGLRRTDSQAPGTCHQRPAPSPDGRLLIYIAVSQCSRGEGLSIAAITSSGRPTKLPFALPHSNRDTNYVDLAWAPAGDALAYATYTVDVGTQPLFSSTALYVSGTDGSRPERIVSWRFRYGTVTWIQCIAWSPDGNWIVFTRRDKASTETWLVRRDGTGLRRITHTRTEDTAPAWLPPARMTPACLAARRRGRPIFCVGGFTRVAGRRSGS
jgi:TolB protein